jgi:hypothetical protein
VHPRPLIVDDGADIRTDRVVDAITVGLAEGAAVSHDRPESIRLVADVALRVAVVLVGDHDDEGEQQPEQRGDDAEHLRGDLGVEPLADWGYQPPDQPDEQEHEADDRCNDRNEEQPDRDVIDEPAQHVPNRTRGKPRWS